ncbi:YggT family protein [[Clostridium] fimetarium]|uniref:YGGT family protein n=1 Tax=[Clostridium] fimetarium TaxID=99656 RepID=A0A1I0M6P8_9FIRM|nr:YggT family protein [[Clostridium] fimetarium]SEV83624.1 YGGT family protein [[Clostridium] fimetarium]
MENFTKQTEMQNVTQESNTGQRIIKVIFGIIEIILAFRIVLKLMGANAGNAFVKGIYNISHPFVKLFEGIFSGSTTGGTETVGVFEPATLIAMIVIGIVAMIVIMLMPNSSNRTKKTQYMEHDE